MPAEYTAPLVQTVLTGQNVLFQSLPYPCCKGYIRHRNNSGLFTLQGCAKYLVQFTGNVAVAAGGTPANGGTVSIALDGEPLASATATTTPAASGEFNSVTAAAIVSVPACCCSTVTVQNSGTEGIDIRNAALIFDRLN